MSIFSKIGSLFKSNLKAGLHAGVGFLTGGPAGAAAAAAGSYVQDYRSYQESKGEAEQHIHPDQVQANALQRAQLDVYWGMIFAGGDRPSLPASQWNDFVERVLASPVGIEAESQHSATANEIIKQARARIGPADALGTPPGAQLLQASAPGGTSQIILFAVVGVAMFLLLRRR